METRYNNKWTLWRGRSKWTVDLISSLFGTTRKIDGWFSHSNFPFFSPLFLVFERILHQKGGGALCPSTLRVKTTSILNHLFTTSIIHIHCYEIFRILIGIHVENLSSPLVPISQHDYMLNGKEKTFRYLLFIFFFFTLFRTN